MNVEEITSALTDVSLSLLPSRMRDVVVIVGLPAFVILVRNYGGCLPLRVPEEATPDHVLWELIGTDAFRALCKRYGGDRIEIAKCHVAAIELRNQQIRYQYFKLDHTQNDLAMRYGLTVRQIRSICYQTTARVYETVQQNLSLF